jgi:DNA-binding transcriptional ArsR family regulator
LSIHVVLRLLSGELRQSILLALAERELDVTTLSALLGEEISAVSHDLQKLRNYGLVQVSRIGKTRIYRLNKHVTIERKGRVRRLTCLGRKGSSVSIRTESSRSTRN